MSHKTLITSWVLMICRPAVGPPYLSAENPSFLARRQRAQGTPQSRRPEVALPYPAGTPHHELDLHAGACAVVTTGAPLQVTARKGGLLRADLVFTVAARFPETPDLPPSLLAVSCPTAIEAGQWRAPAGIPAGIEGERDF